MQRSEKPAKTNFILRSLNFFKDGRIKMSIIKNLSRNLYSIVLELRPDNIAAASAFQPTGINFQTWCEKIEETHKYVINQRMYF